MKDSLKNQPQQRLSSIDYVENLIQIGRIEESAIVVFLVKNLDKTNVVHGDIEVFIRGYFNRIINDVGIYSRVENRTSPVDKFYIEPEFSIRDQDNPITVDQMMNIGQKLAITGGAGSGKTMTLHSIISECIKGVIKAFPVYIRLSELSLESVDLSIWSAILERIKVPNYHSEGLIRQLLQQTEVLLLLDGLDEIVSQKQQRSIFRQVNQLTNDYDSLKVVLTSRKEGFFNHGGTFQCLSINPLKLTKIKDFVNNWYSGEPEKAKMFFQAWRFIVYNIYYQYSSSTEDRAREMLETPALYGTSLLNDEFADYIMVGESIANNPLILRLLCILYDRYQQFETSESEILSDTIDYFISNWAESKDYEIENQPDLSKMQIRRFLEFLASKFEEEGITINQKSHVEELAQIHFESKGYRPFNYEKLIDVLHKKYGLLESSDGRSYRFFHVAIQEFLASSRRFKDETDLIEQFFINGEISKSGFHYYKSLTSESRLVFKKKSLKIARSFLQAQNELNRLHSACLEFSAHASNSEEEMALCYFFYLHYQISSENSKTNFYLSLRVLERIIDLKLDQPIKSKGNYTYGAQHLLFTQIAEETNNSELNKVGKEFQSKYSDYKRDPSDYTLRLGPEEQKQLFGFLQIFDVILFLEGPNGHEFQSDITNFIQTTEPVKTTSIDYKGANILNHYEWLLYGINAEDSKQGMEYIWKGLSDQESLEAYLHASNFMLSRNRHKDLVEIATKGCELFESKDFPNDKIEIEGFELNSLEECFWLLKVWRAKSLVELASISGVEHSDSEIRAAYSDFKSVPLKMTSGYESFFAATCSLLGYKQEAIKLYEISVDKLDDYVIGYIQLLNLYILEGDIGKAKATFKKIDSDDKIKSILPDGYDLDHYRGVLKMEGE